MDGFGVDEALAQSLQQKKKGNDWMGSATYILQPPSGPKWSMPI